MLGPIVLLTRRQSNSVHSRYFTNIDSCTSFRAIQNLTHPCSTSNRLPSASTGLCSFILIVERLIDMALGRVAGIKTNIETDLSYDLLEDIPNGPSKNKQTMVQS